ncbi:hypothetical protein SAMN05421866_0411 [Chryseobacterium oranimense]|uniref:Uncharacterized protein n=1 Tax=Chryseobacterium oranimense TaxID=421058 RepID=A0A1M5JPT0_9FLAO|nr:hypothetical protein SAMN05421866_0411 [Chryseobacterium oranimense]
MKLKKRLVLVIGGLMKLELSFQKECICKEKVIADYILSLTLNLCF